MLEKRLFVGGMDGDSEDRFIKQGDWRFALNCRAGNSDKDSLGAIENTKGNTLVSINLPGGVNTCIGTHEDKKNNTVIYFVHNDNGDHQILQYFPNLNNISSIIKSDLLNFSTDNLITGISLVEGNLLYWTDDRNEPSQLNIQRSRNTFGGIGGGADVYPSPFKRQYLDAIKYPPLCNPTAVYSTDTTRKVNNLKGRLYQLKYQYEYIDGEKSVWSPISKVPLPDETNFYRDDIVENNLITVTLEGGDQYVSKINIAAREGNLGDFFLVDTLVKSEDNIPSNTTFDFLWYNDRVTSPILIPESNLTYDRVPRKAKAQTLIDGNRIGYANYLENYNNPKTVDIKATPVYTQNIPGEAILGGTASARLEGFNSKNITTAGRIRDKFGLPQSYGGAGGTYQSGFKTALPDLIPIHLITINGPLYGVETFTLDIVFRQLSVGPQDLTRQYIVDTSTGNFNTPQDVVAEFARQINDFSVAQVGKEIAKTNDRPLPAANTNASLNSDASGPTIVASGPNGRLTLPGDNTLDIVPAYDILGSADGGNALESNRILVTMVTKDISINVDIDEEELLESFTSFKRGAMHEFGVIYSDEKGRTSTVNISRDSNAYVEFFTSTDRGSVGMDIEVFHQPPDWAKKWQLVYTKNQTIINDPEGRGFIQFAGAGQRQGTTNRYDLFITSINRFGETNPTTHVVYDFAVGDRARFYDNNDNLIDTEIIEFDEDNNSVVIELPDNTFFSQDNRPYEIYTPKKQVNETDRFYFEIGECFDIGNPGQPDRFHATNVAGNEQDFSIGKPALVRLDRGDVYYKNREMGVTPNTNKILAVEDSHFSDFYVSNVYDVGRPHVVNPNYKEIRRETTAIFSDILIPDTLINGLNRFFEENFKDYDKEYGSIQKLYSEDKKVICFQELKVGQILVNEQVLFNQSASATIQKSDQVLNDIIYYQGEFGIGKHPESFAVYGMAKYFIDVQRGSVLRLSNDGITEISSYLMDNYFEDSCREILLSSGADILGVEKKRDIYGAFDVGSGEYVISLDTKKEVSGDVNFFLDVSVKADVTFEFPVEKDVVENPDTVFTLVGNDGVETTGTLTLTQKDGKVYSGDPTQLQGIAEVRVITLSRETLAFSERTNRWTTFYSYLPEFMSGSNVDLVTFKDGNIWLHNSNETYNNFYGEQFTSRVTPVSNQDPSDIKVYIGTEVESNNRWSLKATNQHGQETELREDDFEVVEDVFWSELLKDKNTPIDDPLIEGDDMRSHSMLMEFESKDTVFTKLFSIGVKWFKSEYTNK
jgi:hypothetical protein